MENVPVLTDKTGQQLVKAMNEANVIFGDVVQEFRTFNGFQALEVGAVATKASEDVAYTFAPALAGSEILAGYKAGRTLMLSIFDQFQKKQYRIPFLSATLLANAMWQFKFKSQDNNNSLGELKVFTINYIINDGTTSVSAGSN